MAAISSENRSPIHLLLFPYPASGHIISLLDLTQRLITRGLTITLLITPPNLHLLQPLLSVTPPSSLQTLILSPPEPILPSPSALISRIHAMRELHDPILDWFRSHPSPPVAIVADFFLGWTHHLAREAGVPHVVFSPSGAYGTAEFYTLWRDAPRNDDPANVYFKVCFDKLPTSPTYPLWQLSLTYRNGKEGDPDWEFFRECMIDNLASWGTVVNSFTELERLYIDHLKEMGHDRVWAVGPLLPPEDDSAAAAKRGGASSIPEEEVMAWLDERPDCSVVYVCFGSRTSLTRDQTVVTGDALQISGVHFIWSVRESDAVGYEDRTAGKGLIIHGWAPQLSILRHRAVATFLTHCGWNSVLESITAGVMMLAWPMGADQHSDARLLMAHLGVALRVHCEGPDNVPDKYELARLLSDSLYANRPERVLVKKLRVAALDSVKEGGSSHRALDDFVRQVVQLKD